MRATHGYLLFFLMAVAPVWGSRLNSDPDVIYTEEFAEKEILLKVVKRYPVYLRKDGGKRLGVVKLGTKAELIGMTDRAFNVSVPVDHGRVAGWVHPKAFTYKNPQFLRDYKLIYAREMQVRRLISQGQIALGMTPAEVSTVLGAPTKRRARMTAQGKQSEWEFVTYEDIDHYNYISDPFTGRVFRQFSHTTREISSQVIVEFTNGLVTAMEEREQEAPRVLVTVPPPLIFPW